MPVAAIATIGSAIIGGVMAKDAASDAADAQREATDKSIAAQKEAQKLDPRVQQLIYGDANAPQPRLKAGVTPIYSQPEPVVKTRTVYIPTTSAADELIYGSQMPYQQEYTDVGQRQLINPASDFETPTQDTGIIGKIGGLLDAQQSSGSNVFNTAVNEYMRGNAIMDLGNVRKTARDLQSGEVPVNTMQAPGMQASGMQADRIDAPSQNNLNLSGAYDRMINGDPAQNQYLTGAIQKGINQSKTAFENMQTDATRNLTENILPSIRSGAQVSGQYGGNRQALAEGRALNDFSTQIGRATSQYGQNNTDAAVAAQAGAFDAGQNRALSAMSGLGAQQYGVAQSNAQMRQQAAAQNAQMQQQAGLANLESQNKAQSQSFANKVTGAGMQSGLLGSVYGMQQNADNAQMNKLGGINSLLAPYTKTPNVNVPQYQPVYSNAAGGALGGATAGMGLYNAFNQPSSNVLPNAASAPSTLPGFMNNTYLNPTSGNSYGLLGSGFPNPKGDL